jgi:glucose-6-phosphate isomerase
MTDYYTAESALQLLIEDDAVGQLRRRTGRMAALGSEDGVLKLDWVEGVSRLLADPSSLEQIEADARAIWQRGIRHIIWAGMGGSILTVQVLHALGFDGGCVDTAILPLPSEEFIALHPLDSTDPAALNAIVRRIALEKDLALPTPAAGEPWSVSSSPADQGSSLEQGEISEHVFLQALLQDVVMVGVAMGMTSEEPITHLEWFTDLLKQAGLHPAEHLLVMALPGSYLDHFAHEQQAPSFSLQPDGGMGTGGRMSAPSTRVFLLPAALFLTRLSNTPGLLRSMLQRAWDEYNLELAASSPAAHPFVQLAAALCESSRGGVCRLLLQMPAQWHILVSWIEQLMEESLGKGGKGIVIFEDQSLNDAAPLYQREGTLRVQVVTEMMSMPPEEHFILLQHSLASQSPQERLAALASSFLGWQLSMALYGYLQHIPFAGQPAVENYKARARALRTRRDPLLEASQWQPQVRDGILILLAPPAAVSPTAFQPGAPQPGTTNTEAGALVPALVAKVFTAAARQAGSLDGMQGSSPERPLQYLDVTVNGMAPEDMLEVTRSQVNEIGNKGLGVPVKLRIAPAAYHSTEQSEMDGPAPLVSLRLVARESEPCLLGSYTTAFLHAQAVSTWQAMLEQGRTCLLLIIDGSLNDAAEPLATFFAEVKERLKVP